MKNRFFKIGMLGCIMLCACGSTTPATPDALAAELEVEYERNCVRANTIRSDRESQQAWVDHLVDVYRYVQSSRPEVMAAAEIEARERQLSIRERDQLVARKLKELADYEMAGWGVMRQEGLAEALRQNLSQQDALKFFRWGARINRLVDIYRQARIDEVIASEKALNYFLKGRVNESERDALTVALMQKLEEQAAQELFMELLPYSN